MHLQQAAECAPSPRVQVTRPSARLTTPPIQQQMINDWRSLGELSQHTDCHPVSCKQLTVGVNSPGSVGAIRDTRALQCGMLGKKFFFKLLL